MQREEECRVGSRGKEEIPNKVRKEARTTLQASAAQVPLLCTSRQDSRLPPAHMPPLTPRLTHSTWSSRSLPEVCTLHTFTCLTNLSSSSLSSLRNTSQKTRLTTPPSFYNHVFFFLTLYNGSLPGYPAPVSSQPCQPLSHPLTSILPVKKQ